MGLKEDVLQRVDLVEYVGRTVKLSKSGADYVGCCPFHAEKSASFRVSPGRQKFKCFGCDKHGDAIDFYGLTHGVAEFGDRLEGLAREVGVAIPEKADALPQDQHRDLHRVLDQASAYYAWQLNQGELGAPAREYLAARGISLEQANAIGIGYAARPVWQKIKPGLMDAAVTVGIVRAYPEGKFGDFLAGRITLPIKSDKGEIIALTGRLAPWGGKEGAKYMNTPESLIFRKGETFFQLDPEAVRAAKMAIVVEGQFDRISMALGGAANTTATCGTALTAHHVARLRRLTKKLLFLYDGDVAGQAAARRGIELAIEGGIIPYISVLPVGEDPDTLVREKGLAGITALARVDGFDWILAAMIGSHPGTAERVAAVESEIFPILLRYPDPVLRDVRIHQVAAFLGVGEKIIQDKLGLIDPLTMRVAALERALLYAVTISGEFQDALLKRGDIADLFDGEALQTVKAMLKAKKKA